jgi:hypothetical protein
VLVLCSVGLLGDWMVVAMNADGSRPVNLQVNVARSGRRRG